MSSQKQDDADVIDLEETSRRGADPPPDAKKFRIRIDKEHFVVDVPEMTGAQILGLVNKDPGRFKLVLRLRGGQTRVIKPDEKVDFRAPGIERFNTMAVDQTEGEAPHRDFEFSADDTEYLNALGLAWSTLVDGGARWLIIHEMSVPAGYNHARVDVAIQIVPGYPDAPLDMAFFYPPLARTDGREIKATQATASIGGRTYQRWSRHRTAQNPWRPGIDNVSTHMFLVEDWLAREFRQ